MQQPHTKLDSGVVFDTDNPFDPSRRIFLIPDPTHALKTTTNNLENSGKKKIMKLNEEWREFRIEAYCSVV